MPFLKVLSVGLLFGTLTNVVFAQCTATTASTCQNQVWYSDSYCAPTIQGSKNIQEKVYPQLSNCQDKSRSEEECKNDSNCEWILGTSHTCTWAGSCCTTGGSCS